MGKKSFQVNVSLSGESADVFYKVKSIMQTKSKIKYVGKDADILRSCMYFYYQYIEIIEYLESLGIKIDKSVEEIKEDLESIRKRLEKVEKK